MNSLFQSRTMMLALLFSTVAAPASGQSREAKGNPLLSSTDVVGGCSAQRGTWGRPIQINIGVDENEDNYISFEYLKNDADTHVTMSVKPKINTDNGRAIYDLLLTAFSHNSYIFIYRCTSDQLSGVVISDDADTTPK